MDRLACMATFVRVVERGSFVAAAEGTGLTATMIGNHVRFLEARLGSRLVNSIVTTRVFGGEYTVSFCSKVCTIRASAVSRVGSGRTPISTSTRVSGFMPPARGSNSPLPSRCRALMARRAMSGEATSWTWLATATSSSWLDVSPDRFARSGRVKKVSWFSNRIWVCAV